MQNILPSSTYCTTSVCSYVKKEAILKKSSGPHQKKEILNFQNQPALRFWPQKDDHKLIDNTNLAKNEDTMYKIVYYGESKRSDWRKALTNVILGLECEQHVHKEMIVLTLYDGSNLPIFQVINIFSREESSTIGNHKNQGHCPLRLLSHLLNPSMTISNHHNLFSQFCILQEATVSCSPNYGKLITTKNLDS